MNTALIERCVEKIRGGDTDAFIEIVRQTQDRLRAHVLWLCPHSADTVDDIAQEVYLYVYHNLDKYESGTDFLAWLKTAARFRVLTHIRSATARAQREERYADAAIVSALAEQEEPEGEPFRIEALRSCLDELPEQGRNLILRRYDGDTDSVALGRLMGKSPVAVRAALARLREQLRKCVESRLSSMEAI